MTIMRALHSRPALLLGALALILFPFGWLGERWPALGAALGVVFATAREHAVGHAMLFALLGAAARALWPRLRRRPLAYGAFSAGAAPGQEALQLLYKRRALVYDDFRDTGVDLPAGAAVFGPAYLAARRRCDAPRGGARPL